MRADTQATSGTTAAAAPTDGTAGRPLPAAASDPSPEGPAESAAPRRWLPPWAATLLRIAFTLVLAGLVLSRLEWPKLFDVFASLDWRWWTAGMLVAFAAHVVAAVRWAGLARPIGFDQPLSSFIRRFLEGMFFSLCLPTSIGGDVVKAYRLSPSAHGRLLAGCTILADRLCGLSALGVLAGTTAITLRFGLSLPIAIALGGGLLLAVVTCLVGIVGSLDFLLSAFPDAHAPRRFAAQLLPYQQRPSLLARAVAWSMIVQTGFVVCVMLIARGIGLGLPAAAWFASVPLVALATVLPISISGIGLREAAFIQLLGPYDVASEQATAVGVLWFLATVIVSLSGGLVYLLDPAKRGSSG